MAMLEMVLVYLSTISMLDLLKDVVSRATKEATDSTILLSLLQRLRNFRVEYRRTMPRLWCPRSPFRFVGYSAYQVELVLVTLSVGYLYTTS